MNENIEIIKQNDFVVKIRKPEGIGVAPVLLFLHGWTGDENSMWVFADKIPKTFLLIAPRAPYKISNQNFPGYTWVEKPSGDWSSLEDFKTPYEKLLNLLDSLSRQYEGDFDLINLAGFSQGAAMAYSFAILNSQRVNKVAGLAGFLPIESENIFIKDSLLGKSIFIAHGTKDQIIKIEEAYKARDILKKAGAKVSFCESNVGHRLDSACYSSFGDFISS